MVRMLIGLTLAVLSVASTFTTASAQGDGDGVDSERTEQTIADIGDAFQAEPVVYQITFPRVHAIVTPAFMLNAFFDEHANHWSQDQTNWAFGGEFIIRRIDEFDLVFSVDYADLSTTDDWWRESDKEIVDTDWGQNTLRLFTFDVAINWLAKIQDYWDFYYGVGLGVAFVIGDFLKTDVDPECIRGAGVDPFESMDGRVVEANCFDAAGNPRLEPGADIVEEDKVPPLLPALSLTVGSRWIIDEQWAIQLELGWKNIYFYGGLELGFIFD